MTLVFQMIIPLFAALVASMTAAKIGTGLLKEYTQLSKREIPDLTLRLDPRLIQFVSFGQVGAAIDSLWIQLLQDPRTDHVRPGEHPQGFFLLDVITTLDPAYFEAYAHGARTLTIIRNDNEGAQLLVKRGEDFVERELGKYPARFRATYWPNAWDISVLRGYIELFELGDLNAAAAAFARAARIPGVPEYVGPLAKRLDSVEGKFVVAERILGQQLGATEENPEAHAVIVEKARALKLARFVFDAERAFQAASARLRRPLSWEKFIQSHPEWARDPEGGLLSIAQAPPDLAGHVITTTPYKAPFASNR